MTRARYLCKDGHKVTAPIGTLEICPLAWCQEVLHEVGPNWGPLKSKKDTAEHYAAEAKDAS